jgi:hypothetical protein
MIAVLYQEISSNPGVNIFMKLNTARQRKNQRFSGLPGVETDAPVETDATHRPANETGPVARTSEHPLIDAIQDRWSLFTDADLQGVRTREGLIAALQSRYRITQDQAATQVVEWLARHGRHI